MITKFDKYIKETLTDKVYHFTYLNRMYQILKSNKINLSPVFGTPRDLEINSNKLYTLSTTSSRSSDIGYAASLPKGGIVRITLDGRMLNNNYKSKRVDFWQRPKDPKDPSYQGAGVDGNRGLYKHVSRQDELEDRVLSDDDSIPNGNKYILAVDVLYDYENDNWDEKKKTNLGYIRVLKGLCDKLDIPFNHYDKQKYFDSNIKSKSLDTKPSDEEIDIKNDRDFYFDDIAAYLILKDDKNKEKIFKYIDGNFEKPEKMKENVVSRSGKIKYDLNYLSDWQIQEKGSAINSYIHNNKSSTNDNIRYIVRQLGLDMKKNNCKTTTEYVNYKIWKGRKTNVDFKKELIEKINSEIDNLIKKNIDNSFDYRYYDKEGYGHDGLKNDKKLLDFFKGKAQLLKDYYKTKIDELDDNFKYTYTLSSYNVKDDLNIDISDYNDFVNDNYDGVEGYTLETVILYTINDLDSVIDKEFDRIKNEKVEQWNT